MNAAGSKTIDKKNKTNKNKKKKILTPNRNMNQFKGAQTLCGYCFTFVISILFQRRRRVLIFNMTESNRDPVPNTVTTTTTTVTQKYN